MDDLRIGLILMGVVVLLVIYWWERRRVARGDELQQADEQAATEPAVEQDEMEPAAEGEEVSEEIARELEKLTAEVKKTAHDEPQQAAVDKESPQHSDQPPGQKNSEHFVVVYVKAHHFFRGPEVRAALLGNGMQYDETKAVFEYPLIDTPAKDSLFTVANIVNPGTFPAEKWDDFQTPGLAFLMVLPGPVETRRAFDTMLQVANSVASFLKGRLLDQDHGVLTRQGINFLREQVTESLYHDQALRKQNG